MQFIKKNLTLLLLILVIILQMGFYGIFYYEFFYLKDKQNDVIEPQKTIEIIDVKNEKMEDNKIFVDVKGAVNKSGVYEVSQNAILNDVITLAGGFKKAAYQNNINLSKKVSDEMVIYIYTKYEYQKLNEPKVKEVIIEKECQCPDYNIDKCVESGSSVITYNPNVKVDTENNENSENGLININTAQIEELKTLTGIGDAKAKNIIDYRNSNGLFTKKEDLLLVSGISEKLYEDIKDHICI